MASSSGVSVRLGAHRPAVARRLVRPRRRLVGRRDRLRRPARWKSVTADPIERYRRSSPIFVHQAGAPQPVAHRALHLREHQLDRPLLEIADQLEQHVGRRHVEVGGRGEVDQEPVRRGAARPEQVADLRLGRRSR